MGTQADLKIHDADWGQLIPPEQWAVYKCVLDHAVEEGVLFALGGGLAVGAYTGRLRNTKDLDIYILPQDRERVVRMTEECGMTDYFEVLPYDRNWIYRAHRDGVILDSIWAMANRRASVDEEWLLRGQSIQMLDRQVRVIPPEELIWSKLYVMQRDRCDWPDIMNLMYATGAHLDWEHMVDRVAEDLPLLKGVLSIFSWVCPEQAAMIPSNVWWRLALPAPKPADDPEGRPARPDLLDTRPWFPERIVQPC